MKKSSARLSLIACLLMISALYFLSKPALSLSSQKDINVTFTFDKVLLLTISSDLVQAGLLPGTSANTNEITVDIATNSETGFTLNATVGNETYNTRSIDHESVANARFENIGIDDSISAIPSGSWGFSVDHGETYSGLPLYSDETNVKELMKTDTNSVESLPFLVSATADSDQENGLYKNVVTFYAVVNKTPTTIDKIQYLQDVDEITFASMQYEKQYRLEDKRDGKKYFISKLRDDNIWMTQNLGFDLYDGIVLNPETSDVLEEKTMSLAPTGGDYNTTSYDYNSNNYQLSMYDKYCPGGYCQSSFSDAGELEPDDVDNHYRIGNFYSYPAATANYFPQCPKDNSDPDYGPCRSSQNSVADAATSICPKNWMLPASSASGNYNEKLTHLNLGVGIGLQLNTGSFQIGSRAFANPVYIGMYGYSYASNSSGMYYPWNNPYAYFWTSTNTYYSSAFYYYFNLNTSNQKLDYVYFYNYPANRDKYYLMNVRCVARKPKYQVDFYMNETDSEEPYTTVSGESWDTPVMIDIKTPRRTGYSFVGWAKSADATEPVFAKGERIVLNAHEASLYAIWKVNTDGNSFDNVLARAGKTATDGYYDMQDVDGEICKQVDVGEKGELRDNRDGKIYTVVKYDISNGKEEYGACWMYDNLALGSTEQSYELTPLNSDVQENFTFPIASSWDTSNSVEYNVDVTSREDGEGRSYGYLYNYNLATAGTAKSIIEDETKSTYERFVITASICPKNWTLPRSSAVEYDSSSTERAVWNSIDPTSQTSNYYNADNPSNTDYKKIINIFDTMIQNFPGYREYGSDDYTGAGSRAVFWTKDLYKRSNSYSDYNSGYVSYYQNESSLYIYTDNQDHRNGYPIQCMIPVNYKKFEIEYNASYPELSQYYTVEVSYDGDSASPTTTLSPNYNFAKRPGYRLIGWSTDNENPTLEYTIDGEYSILENQEKLYLYAVWEPISETGTVSFDDAFATAGKEKYNGYYAMQDITPEICDAVSNNMSGRLIDKRDDKVYWVLRIISLYDNNREGVCWMTQNLDFELATDGTATVLDPLTSDVNEAKSFHAQPITQMQNDEARRYQDGGDYYLEDGGLPYSGMSYNEPRNTIITSTDDLTADDIRWHYHLGSYYGWAAMATIEEYRRNLFPDGNNLSESICPKGWQVPNDYSDGTGWYASISFPRSKSYKELYLNILATNIAYENNKYYLEPFYPVSAGYVGYSQAPFDQLLVSTNFGQFGQYAYYWSGNKNNDSNAFNTTFSAWIADEDEIGLRTRYSSSMSTTSNNYYYMMPVRCVAR